MPLRLILTLLLLATAATRLNAVDLSLDDYQQWQGYNGWRIQVIKFPGIKSFARAEILTVMATEKPTWLRRYVRIGSRTIFYADDFTADLFRIERFFRREGFPNAVIRGSIRPREKHRELVLKVEIVEGPSLLLKNWRLDLRGPQDVGVDSARWALAMPIKIGKRLALSDVKTSADTLAYKLRQIGHARARVEYIVETDSVENTAEVTFILEPGSFCYFGQTHITGLKQLSHGTARRELTFRDFEPFAPHKLEETRLRLVRLEIFNFVSVRADTTVPGDTLPVWIETQEGWRYRVRLGAGYDTDERARASAEFVDLNFFGRGRRLTWGVSIAEIRRQTEARLFWPHTPWNATDITLAPKWELNIEKAYHLETQTASTILSASPLPKVTASLSNEVGTERRRDRVDSLDAESQLTSALTILKSVETVSAAWDTRDNPLVPRMGHMIGLTFSESGAVYRTDQRWWRALLAGRVFIPATRFTVLAGKSEIGIMGPLHDSPVTPIQERFYLGGPSTVRGWARRHLSPRAEDADRTPLGGNFSFYLTTELRHNVWGPVTLALFMDAGNVWKKERDWQPLDVYPSVGTGLLFLSMVGPLRVDFAHQMRENLYRERPWAIHFSLGTPF
ncbi:BamA/TamA family outer membrane protein [bacterium]|nr:BamA/TamA family outer membrane protein [bacterium]MBU1984547.1 BamA/TamA family outer membrane protein [bacterium]